MKIYNCWCGKASPIQLLNKSENAVIYECLQCKGTITVILERGEEWKERSCNEYTN